MKLDRSLQRQLLAVEDIRDRALHECREKATVERDEVLDAVCRAWRTVSRERMIVGIAGFPASGKTLLAKAIVAEVNERHADRVAAHLPMDGFHYTNSRLRSLGLENVKGSVATYDVAAFTETLRTFKAVPSRALLAPDYIRELHEVREDAVKIGTDTRVLVTEGIYVGCMEGTWTEARAAVDVLLFLDVAPAVCARRIIARNRAVGRDHEQIREKLKNDFGFMEKSIGILQTADYVVRDEGSGDRAGS